jgi:hypothetical protein
MIIATEWIECQLTSMTQRFDFFKQGLRVWWMKYYLPCYSDRLNIFRMKNLKRPLTPSRNF